MEIGQLEVTLTAEDFMNLWDESMDWGNEWKTQADRFNRGISFDWQKAYFFEVSYANFILAKSYLKAIGAAFDFTSDEAGGWVILTDYDWADA